MSIDPRDVSVVVQGPIVRRSTDPASEFLTREVIASVQRTLAGAEVILSTWVGEEIRDLPCDACVLSEDPGAVVPNPDFPARRNNVNRQLVSTSAGLARATRKYAVKLRTDTPLLHAGFLDVPRTGRRHPEWRLFGERILLPKELSLHPAVVPSLYHASDCFQFGLTADLRDLWAGPLAPEPETSRAFPRGAPPPLVYNIVEGPHLRMSAEQYVLISFLRRRGVRADLSYICDCRLPEAATALLFMANNFEFASTEQLGVRLPQRIVANPMSLLSATSDAWSKTTRHLGSKLGSCLHMPLELVRVWLKWLHFWVRYSLKPRLRGLRSPCPLASEVRP